MTSGQGVGAFVALLLLAVGVVWAAAWCGSVAWAWRDAERRGQPGFIVAVLVALLCWPLSLLVWLAARPDAPTPSAAPRHRGWLWALIAFIAIITLTVAIPILAAIVLPALSAARDRAHRTACMQNIHRISAAYEVYCDGHNGNPPASFEDLSLYGVEQEVLRCPSSADPSTPSYRLFPGTNSDDLIVIENPRNHCGKGGNVGYRDAHVEWTPCRPISIQTVVAAIHAQLPPALEMARPGAVFAGVGKVTFHAPSGTYHAEVFWKYKGRDGRSIMKASQLIDDRDPALVRFLGQFPLNDIERDPQGEAYLVVTMDELMDGHPSPASDDSDRGARR